MFMYKLLCKVNNSINSVLQVLIVFLLASMSGMVFMQVVFRYVLKSPIAWSEELATYFFSWLAYFGAAVVLKSDSHVAISTVIDSIKNIKLKKMVIIFGHLLTLVFMCVVVYLASSMTMQFFTNDQRAINMDFLKMGYVFLQVPVSSTIMALIILEKIMGTINGDRSLSSVEGVGN